MTLPLAVSVPHAGWRVPPELEHFCVLTQREIEEDGDVGAREIYSIRDQVAHFETTEVARAILDLNRSIDDRHSDGIVKTHTCWNVQVYDPFPPESVFQDLIESHYDPYHERLSAFPETGARLAIDCHTMAAEGPPVGPDPGVARPHVCLSNADGTCPADWIQTMADCFRETFGSDVRINEPFRGGYITRTHASEMPWMQLELSRAPYMTVAEKREAVLGAFRRWCERVPS